MQYNVDFGALDVLLKLEDDSPPLTITEARRLLELVLANPDKVATAIGAPDARRCGGRPTRSPASNR